MLQQLTIFFEEVTNKGKIHSEKNVDIFLYCLNY